MGMVQAPFLSPTSRRAREVGATQRFAGGDDIGFYVVATASRSADLLSKVRGISSLKPEKPRT